MRISDWSSDVCSSDLGSASTSPSTTTSRRRARALGNQASRCWASPRAGSTGCWTGTMSRSSRRRCRKRPRPPRTPSSAAKSPFTMPRPRGLARCSDLEPCLQDAVGRRVAVDEGFDRDDDLLAHGDAALDGGRAHVRQQHHVVEAQKLGIDRRLLLEDVEARPGALPGLQRAGRSEEHTSELKSPMRISYAVLCLTKKKK